MRAANSQQHRSDGDLSARESTFKNFIHDKTFVDYSPLLDYFDDECELTSEEIFIGESVLSRVRKLLSPEISVVSSLSKDFVSTILSDATTSSA